MNRLTLIKGPTTFIIVYDAESHRAVIDELIAMVGRPELGFDYFDCCVMSHQLGQQMSVKVHEMISGKGATS